MLSLPYRNVAWLKNGKDVKTGVLPPLYSEKDKRACSRWGCEPELGDWGADREDNALCTAMVETEPGLESLSQRLEPEILHLTYNHGGKLERGLFPEWTRHLSWSITGLAQGSGKCC